MKNAAVLLMTVMAIDSGKSPREKYVNRFDVDPPKGRRGAARSEATNRILLGL